MTAPPPRLLLVLTASLLAAATSPRRLELDAADARADTEIRIAPGLWLRVDRDHWAGGDFIGWDVGVYGRRGGRGDNLLYASRQWHGAHPSQVYAWSEAEQYFGPGTRRLRVRGRAWEVQVECVGCETRASGDHRILTAGKLRVTWRPTDRARD